MERRTSIVGIYGGTFDPIHLGHLHLAKTLLSQFNFERFLFVPAKQNPLKKSGPMISDADRLSLMRTALQDLSDKRIQIDESELKRAGVSYTIDTLKQLSQETRTEMALIIGDEVFQQLPAWKNPQEILALANLIVVKRHSTLDPDTLFKSLGLPLGQWKGGRYEHQTQGKSTKWIQPVEINALPHSSTAIRAYLSTGWKTGVISSEGALAQGIQHSVWLLIKEKQLYAVK